jgi:hypothetical protein
MGKMKKPEIFYGWKNSCGGYIYTANLEQAEKYREIWNFEFGETWRGKLGYPREIPRADVKFSHPNFCDFNTHVDRELDLAFGQ